MFGDGASNTGNFGETMNLAALWSLPIVFLVENNLYGMGTSIERHSAVTDLSHKAEGLGVPGERVDGMDVVAMRECVTEHLKTAREDRRPTLVEAFTYRYRGHSAADPEVYREKEEVEEWRQKDPIETFARRLEEEGIIEAGHLDELREEVEEQVIEAVEFADASPEPPLDSLYDNLYVVEGESEGWYAVDERTPDPFRGEREREAAEKDRVRDLHEAGASLRRPVAALGRAAAARVPADERPGGRGGAGSTPSGMQRTRATASRTRAIPDGDDADEGGAERRAPRGDGARRDRLPDGRGHRRLRRRVQGHRGADGAVRRARAFATRRSRRTRSSAPGSARRWPGCARSSS